MGANGSGKGKYKLTSAFLRPPSVCHSCPPRSHPLPFIPIRTVSCPPCSSLFSYMCWMLQISDRGQQMPPSPIRKLVPFAEAAKKKGVRVFHLNIGQPDIETPPSIIQAVKDADIRVREYSHSAGNESYRRKLVQYYQSVGIQLTPDQILVTTGGSE